MARRARGEKIKFHERSRPRARGPTCIDLFSGAGGLAEGFRQAGWSVLSGNDVDADAAATFRLNFPAASFFEGPISALSAQAFLRDGGLKAGELDCLIGGPPCQSYSYNNHLRSARGARAQLFRDYLRIVKALRPKTLLMENVPGMLSISGGRIVEEIEDALGALGYDCEIRIMHAEDYGVPQTRRRAIVAASRIGAAARLFPAGRHGPSWKPSKETNPFVHRWEPRAGVETDPFVTVWDAIGDLPRLKSGGGEHVFRLPEDPPRRLYNHVCHDLSQSLLTRIAHVPEGGNWRDIPRRLLTAGMRRAHKSCHTKRYGRLARTGLASTILTKCDPHWGAYIHPTQNRTISVREAARLQGFPDRFRFAGDCCSKHYEQVGNAVPVPLAKALAAAVKRHIATCCKPQRRKMTAAERRFIRDLVLRVAAVGIVRAAKRSKKAAGAWPQPI